MSNYLAVATVTAVLRDMLQEAVGVDVPGATVTTRRPEGVDESGQKRPVVNIFLYRVTPNAAWRNTDIEIRRYADQDAPTERIERRPQLPLNLNYLFSFYGNELGLEPQRLLGSVVSAIHARPRLSPEAIRRTVQGDAHLRRPDLDAQSYLDFQVERIEDVTLTPITLSLEELSKLWSVFFQVPYALSVAYEAAAVLLEAGAPRSRGRVREIHIGPPEVTL